MERSLTNNTGVETVYFDILDHTHLHIACKNIAHLHTLNTRKSFQVVIKYHVGEDVLNSFAFFSIVYQSFQGILKHSVQL